MTVCAGITPHRYHEPIDTIAREAKDVYKRQLKALSDDVVYLGTVSKVFAPGLRTGWIAAPKSVLARINLVKQGTDLCGSAFTQVVVEHYLSLIHICPTPGGPRLPSLRACARRSRWSFAMPA